MLDERFVYLTLLLNLTATAHYIAMIRHGQVRPNRASWLLWALAPAVVLAAELDQGVGLRTVLTFGIALGPLLVVIASYTTPTAYWKVGALDWACGGLSGLALMLWAVTESAAVAIILSIAADALAAIPTIRKAVTHPALGASAVLRPGVDGGCPDPPDDPAVDLRRLGLPALHPALSRVPRPADLAAAGDRAGRARGREGVTSTRSGYCGKLQRIDSMGGPPAGTR